MFRYFPQYAVAIVFLALVATGVSSCSQEIENSQSTIVLNRGLSGDPESLDPHKISSNQSQTVLREIGEGLVRYGADGSIVPGIAEYWEITENQLSITFHIRPEATWSNGSPLRASDFVFGLRRLVDPKTAAPYAEFLSAIVNAKEIFQGVELPTELGVFALDETTLRIDLRVVTPYFLELLANPATYPIDQKSYSEIGPAIFRVSNYVASGAYQPEAWEVGSAIVLTRNENYWDNDAVAIDRVIYHIVNQSVEYQRYIADEIDITANVPESSFSRIREQMPTELRVSPYLGIYYYGFNLVDGPFAKNLKLRQALSMAIDREALAEKVIGRGELAAYSWVPPDVRSFDQQTYSFKSLDNRDRENEARKLFNESGVGGDEKFSFELRFNMFEGNRRIAVAIQSMWREVLGVEAKLVNEEYKVFIDTVREQRDTELFWLSWTGDYNDAYSFLQLFQGGNPSNLTGFFNQEVNMALEQAEIEEDQQTRQALLELAERVALSEFPVIPLYFYVSKHLVKPRVSGWEENILDIHLTRDLTVQVDSIEN